MRREILSLLIGVAIVFCHRSLSASSSLPMALDERIDGAKAIFRGTVGGQQCYRDPADGQIYTRTTFSVDEGLKGLFPKTLQVVQRGGVVRDEGEVESSSPRFQKGEERLMFLDQRSNGTLFAFDGPASAILLHRQNNAFSSEENDWLAEIHLRIPDPSAEGIDTTSQAAVPSKSIVGGLLADGNGISSRFSAPDRGEPIPYIVDAQALPAGISLPQALGAVSNALKAWSDASSARFVYEGLQNFGTNAFAVNINDGKIRIQLHDLYGYITTTNVLGTGGRNYSIPVDFPNGGMGGNVAGKEFFQNTRGALVLKHTDPSMQTLSTFEEVLCHELGHVLSLDHSSENLNEPDPVLKDAIMYYQVHKGGRGATLGTYDGPKIRTVHPLNTPPYGYSRIMDIVTSPFGAPAVPGINQVQLRGYDLQGTTLTLSITNQTTNNGSFSLTGSNLNFSPGGYYLGPAIDPAGFSYYDRAFARFSDGSNASPYISIRALSLLPDSYPDGASDGIPDDWMQQYFGNRDPAVGSKHGAADDFDGDGVSNLQEFINGTDPTDASSTLKVTGLSATNFQFLARAYYVYEIQTSPDLSSWSRATNCVTPTTTNAAYSGFATRGAAKQFFRVLKVP